MSNTMHLTINELLAYTDEERKKWKDWLALQGNGPLKIALAGDAFSSIGGLILHIFWAELFYALWMRGEVLSENSPIVIENKSLPPDDVEKVFAFGRLARRAMREFTDAAREDDWERTHEVEARGIHIKGPARKLIAHILIHEIRHWAQVAIVVRQHDLPPPGDHDLLFSESFGKLVTRV